MDREFWYLKIIYQGRFNISKMDVRKTKISYFSCYMVYCPTFRCIACKSNYEGPYCDQKICKNDGKEQIDGSCKCEYPYSGEFCDTSTTEDIYLYYNRMIRSFGPIGAITIIPMILINYGCSRLAQKRQIKRVERSFEEQTKTDISKHAIENLLKQ